MSPEQLEQKPYNHKVAKIHPVAYHQFCLLGGYLQSGFDIPGAVGTHHNGDGANNGKRETAGQKSSLDIFIQPGSQRRKEG